MRDQPGPRNWARMASTSASLYAPSFSNSKLRTTIDFRPAISFLASASSPFDERNLPASCSILLSSVTSTVSLAFAPRCGGSFSSCARSGARASSPILMLCRIDCMNLLLYELQFAAGDAQRQQYLL